MLKILCALCAVILISSCSRENIDGPKPLADPVLKRTVQTNTVGAVMRVSYYNEFELVTFDTTYITGTQNPGMINVSTYNSKGKRIRLDNTIPALYTGGYYWGFRDDYQDDTIPTVSYRYLKGNQVARIQHFYNTSKQLVLDSTYHTPNFGTFTYLDKFEYDMLGRLSHSISLNDTRDTTDYITYQYAPNTIEKSVIHYDRNPAFNPPFVSYSKTVTTYTASGKISSQKEYGGQIPQLSTQTDYTYDATGHLLKKTILTPGSPVQEDRYFNNSTTGKPEKMEFYRDNQLGYTVTYYYE